jgi:uracil-DNA glycosylase
MKPLFIGEAPGKRWKPGDKPLGGRSAGVLAKLLGLDSEDFYGRIDAVNLMDKWPGPGPSGKGATFDPVRAMHAAVAVPVEGRRVVYCGRRVARAFGFVVKEFFVQIPNDARAAESWVIPHPSGINRWWNDPKNRRKAARWLREFMGPDALRMTEPEPTAEQLPLPVEAAPSTASPS